MSQKITLSTRRSACDWGGAECWSEVPQPQQNAAAAGLLRPQAEQITRVSLGGGEG